MNRGATHFFNSFINHSKKVILKMGVVCLCSLDILFLSNHKIHKSLCGLCFWASDTSNDRFYKNLSIKGSEAQKQWPHKLLWMLRFDEKSISNVVILIAHYNNTTSIKKRNLKCFWQQCLQLPSIWNRIFLKPLKLFSFPFNFKFLFCYFLYEKKIPECKNQNQKYISLPLYI